jgi:hypothetical protein
MTITQTLPTEREPAHTASPLEQALKDLEDARKQIKEIKDELDASFTLVRKHTPPPNYNGLLRGFDVYGQSIPLDGHDGGDLVKCINFNDPQYKLNLLINRARDRGDDVMARRLEKSRSRFGLVLIDVSGHSRRESIPAAFVYNSYSMGIADELATHGKITHGLDERVNDQAYIDPVDVKMVTAVRTIINKDGKGIFTTAGHPPPYIFRAGEKKFDMSIQKQWDRSFPFGILPSKAYAESAGIPGPIWDQPSLNRFTLGRGDSMLLYSDGLMDHGPKDKRWFPGFAEGVLKRAHTSSAKDIVEALTEDIVSYSTQQDDITLCVIKRE